jgi:beta-phosphoglucomutase-like phosphatase (HAD superfamily)
MTTTMSPRAFIFDMDGTIVDNMAFHTKSWLAFFERAARSTKRTISSARPPARQGREIMRERLGANVSMKKIRRSTLKRKMLYREMYARTGNGRGLRAVHRRVRADRRQAGRGHGRAAAEHRVHARRLDLRRHFDAVVGAADVARGKPNPDVFLLAAERCGVAPADCIVFEDAPMGVEAARRAGMRAVVLTTTLPAEAFAEFDNVICIVAGLCRAVIDALFAGDPDAIHTRTT